MPKVSIAARAPPTPLRGPRPRPAAPARSRSSGSSPSPRLLGPDFTPIRRLDASGAGASPAPGLEGHRPRRARHGHRRHPDAARRRPPSSASSSGSTGRSGHTRSTSPVDSGLPGSCTSPPSRRRSARPARRAWPSRCCAGVGRCRSARSCTTTPSPTSRGCSRPSRRCGCGGGSSCTPTSSGRPRRDAPSGSPTRLRPAYVQVDLAVPGRAGTRATGPLARLGPLGRRRVLALGVDTAGGATRP